MANTKGRTYAEDLVGALDRSALGLQRDVAQSTYNTNWKNIQNQYENLQAQLKQKQEQANKDYANGLIEASSNSFDRMRNYASNMNNRGLTSSGLNNLVQQSDIKQKGKEIGELLSAANDVSSSTAESLSNAGTTANSKLNELAGNLSSTLGNITAKDIEQQSSYNTTLAQLAEAMESRLDQNDLVRQSINDTLSSARRSSNSNSDIDAKLEQLYKNMGISEILNSSNLGDEEKAAYLTGLYEIDNVKARNAVKASNINKIEDLNAYKKSKQEELNINKNQLKHLKSANNVSKQMYEDFDSGKKYAADRAAKNYENSNSTIAKLFIKAMGGRTQEEMDKMLRDSENSVSSKKRDIKLLENEIKNLKYQDLYDILYK